MSRHFEAMMIPADRWRRLGQQAGPANGSATLATCQFKEARPHIVTTTDTAQKILIAESAGWVGRTGLCPGEYLDDDGVWKTGYRFQNPTTIETLNAIIPDLDAQIERLVHAYD